MSRNIENHDSVLLLQDCIAGCKMALESMDDIREHTDDKQLRELIDKYYDEHTGLSVDCRDMLDKAGADIKCVCKDGCEAADCNEDGSE